MKEDKTPKWTILLYNYGLAVPKFELWKSDKDPDQTNVEFKKAVLKSDSVNVIPRTTMLIRSGSENAFYAYQDEGGQEGWKKIPYGEFPLLCYRHKEKNDWKIYSSKTPDLVTGVEVHVIEPIEAPPFPDVDILPVMFFENCARVGCRRYPTPTGWVEVCP